MKRNGNGPQIMAVNGLEGLAALLEGARQEPEKTPEQEAQERKDSFTKIVDAIVSGEGCGAESHRPAEDALVALLKASHKFDVIPEPVANAICRTLAIEAMHGSDNIGDSLKRTIENVSVAILVAGVVMRVKDLPETAGIRLSTGTYL
jgi:hypothetical protein